MCECDGPGWVATTNAVPEDEHGNAVVFVSNFERLQVMAFAHTFSAMGQVRQPYLKFVL